MNEITYHVEVADMQAFQRHHRRVSPQVRRVRIFIWLFFSAVSLHSAFRYHATAGLRVLHFFVMLALLIAVVASINFIVDRIAQFRAHHHTDRNGLLGEHTITLAPEELREQTAVNDSRARWSGIFRIDSTPGHFFIFTQPNAAYVIPRRAFPTAGDAEQFLSTARTYHEAATSPVTASVR